MNSDLYEPIILSIALAVGVRWVWRREPGHPYRRFLRFGMLVAFLGVFGHLVIEIVGTEPKLWTGGASLAYNVLIKGIFFPVSAASVVLLLHSYIILRRDSEENTLSQDNAISPHHNDPTIPPPPRQSLTFHNSLAQEVIALTSTRDDPAHPELVAVAAIKRGASEKIEEVVYPRQRFYMVAAKGTTGTDCGNIIFIRRFTWEELEAQGWTVVIEPGYGGEVEPPLPREGL